MPERQDVERERLLSCILAQLANQLEHAVDVVVVDVAHHQHADFELSASEVRADLVQPRLKRALVDRRGPPSMTISRGSDAGP